MFKQWAIHASAESNLDFGTVKLAIFGAAGRIKR